MTNVSGIDASLIVAVTDEKTDTLKLGGTDKRRTPTCKHQTPRLRLQSRKQSPRLFGLLHASHAKAQCRQAHRDFLFAAQVEGLCERALQDAEEFVHHLALRPEEALQILNPLEIRNHHAARVAENVRDYKNVAALFENNVSFGCRRSVGGLGQNAALNFAGVGCGDLSFQSGGYKNVARRLQQSIIRDWLRFRKTGDRPSFRVVLFQF